MVYLQPMHEQLAVFCRMAGFGFLLGVAYDLTRWLRHALARRSALPWDVGFSAFAAPATFLFSLTQNGGRLRLHLLLALALGMGVWLFFAGVPFRRAGDRLLRRTRRACARIRAVGDRMGVFVRKCGAPLKKVVKKVKKPLAIRSHHGV